MLIYDQQLAERHDVSLSQILGSACNNSMREWRGGMRHSLMMFRICDAGLFQDGFQLVGVVVGVHLYRLCLVLVEVVDESRVYDERGVEFVAVHVGED